MKTPIIPLQSFMLHCEDLVMNESSQQIAVTHSDQDGVVLALINKHGINYLAMDFEQARDLGEILIQHATGEPS